MAKDESGNRFRFVEESPKMEMETSPQPRMERRPRDPYEQMPSLVLDCTHCDYFCRVQSNLDAHVRSAHPETFLMVANGE